MDGIKFLFLKDKNVQIESITNDKSDNHEKF